MKRWYSLTTLALALGLANLGVGQIVYDPATQWDGTNNPSPNGPWSYGVKSGETGTFTLFSTHVNTLDPGGTGTYLQEWGGSDPIQVPVVSFNANETTWGGAGPTIVAPHELDLHPGGLNQWATLRFTASFTGSYTFAGTLSGNSSAGTTTTTFLVHNTTTFLTHQLAGYNTSYSFSEARTMSAGDTVDVVVDWGYNGTNGADATGLTMTVTAIPEPSTYAALAGLSALGFALLRRRRRLMPLNRG